MMKICFTFFIIGAILLSFVSCSNPTANDTVVEQGNGAYSYTNGKFYYPHEVDYGNGRVNSEYWSYDTETEEYSTLFSAEQSGNGKKTQFTYYKSVAVWNTSLYCCINQSSGAYDFLVKINTETGEYKQLDYMVSGLLWQSNDIIYFCGYQKDDSDSRKGIYKMNMSDDSVTLIYADNNVSNIIKGTEEDIKHYSFYGGYEIGYIQGNTIYFVKKNSNSTSAPSTICTIQTNGKKYKEHYSTKNVYHLFPLNDRIYFYGTYEITSSFSSNCYIEKNSETVEYADIRITDEINLHEGNIYGFLGSDFCRVTTDDTNAKPQILFNDRGSLEGFCGDWIITSQEGKVYHVIKCDGTESKHFYSIEDAYKYAFTTLNFSEDNAETESNETKTEIASQESSKYDTIKALFDKNKEELYNGISSVMVGTEGSSEIYKAPNSENIYYYFPLNGTDELLYLYAINAPVSFLFDGKDHITLAELKEEFGDNLKTEYSDYMGAYTAHAEFNGLSFSFGTYENEETAFFELVLIQETKIN